MSVLSVSLQTKFNTKVYTNIHTFFVIKNYHLESKKITERTYSKLCLKNGVSSIFLALKGVGLLRSSQIVILKYNGRVP